MARQESVYSNNNKDSVYFASKRPDIPETHPNSKVYRNPIIYTIELNNELVRYNLTRKQLAEKHGITSDRVTQLLGLLKLPEDVKIKIETLGDRRNSLFRLYQLSANYQFLQSKRLTGAGSSS